MISTFAKLEKWVSEDEHSQKLISDLERKIGGDNMKDLEKELNDKELKNNLCFNAMNIDNIRKNKELEDFLITKSNAKFPKLTFSMFFKKSRSASSGKKAERSTGHDEPMDTDINENKDNMDVQETHSDEKDGQPQPPGQSQNVSPKCPSEPITKNETLLEDTNSDNAEHFRAELLHKTSPASASDNMPSKGSWDTQEKSEAEIKAQNKDTSMPAPEETKLQERDGSSTEFHTGTSGAVKDPTGKSSCSNTESALATNKRGKSKENVLKKKNCINNLFLNWAEGQCNGCKEEFMNPVDQISIILDRLSMLYC